MFEVAEKNQEVPDRARSISSVDDPDYRRRLLVAFAMAFAMLEVVAGLWPSPAPPPPKPEVIAMRITLSKHTPPPTPVPTPRITPPPHPKLAQKIEVRSPSRKAVAPITHKLGGAASHKRIVHVKVPPKPHRAPPASIVAGTHLGRANGGSGTGAGPGAGTGGLNGTGAGQGNAGNGTGGEADTSPCGVVTLIPEYVDYHKDGTVIQHVQVSITLRDGSTYTGRFPYPFTYSAERLNPFSHDDQLVNGGVPVQLPPAGFDTSQLDSTVQVVLAHTDASGHTTLPECPKRNA